MVSNRPGWNWAAAAFSLIAGAALVLTGTSAGWIFVILGFIYFGLTTRAGQTWATANPRVVRYGLVAVVILFGLLLIAGIAVFLLR